MSGSMRTCTSCQMQFRVRSHRERRYQCFVCKPDRKNVSMQSNTRKAKTTNDALSRLSELEDKVESLSTQFEFYGNTMDTIRDSVIDELVSDTQDRVHQVSGQIIEKLVNKRITDFKEGMWKQMKAIDKKHTIVIEDMREEMGSMLMNITKQRVLITELNLKLDEANSIVDALRYDYNKKTVQKKEKRGRTPIRHKIGRASLTRMQYDSIRRWCEQAQKVAELNHILPSQVRFDTPQLKKYAESKSVSLTVRTLMERGLMRTHKERPPTGSRGPKYSWSIYPKCFTHDFSKNTIKKNW